MTKEISNNALDTTDLDIVDVFNACLPFEKHLPGMNYCGPGTNLLQKLASVRHPKRALNQ